MTTGQSHQALALTNSQNVQNVQLGEPAEGGLELGKIWAALRRKAFLIIGITAAVTCAAGVRALTETPKYKSSFEVLIQPTTAESQVLSSLPNTLSDNSKETEAVSPDLLEILVSRKLLIPVIKDLEAKDPDFCDRLLASKPADSSKPKTTSSLSEDSCYAGIILNLTLKPLGDAQASSNIVKIEYQGADPESIQTFLDQLSKAYLSYSLDSRQADIRRGIEFVEKKLPDLRQRVETLQDQLQQLRLKYNLIDPDNQSSQLTGQVNAFTGQQIEAQQQLEEARATYANLVAQLTQRPTETAASSALKDNSRYQTVLNQLLALDTQIAQSSTLYLSASPDMQVLYEQRQNLLKLLAKEGQQSQREVINQIQDLETHEQTLQQTINSLNGGIRELTGVSRTYADITRELDISTQNLNQFLTKREALQIDAAQREIPWELLTPPTSPAPFAASLPLNLILGAVLGLLLGMGAALALDKFADVIHTSEELKLIARFPLLGAIPRHQSLEGVNSRAGLTASLQQVGSAIRGANRSERTITHPYEAPTFYEAFRSLYANIRLLNSETPIRSFVVSSTVPGEGKSTVSVGLAEAAAALGKRVLLVDTDLRRPRLHEYLNLINTQGLTNVVAGDVLLRTAIQRSPLEPNMFVLTAGAIPPDPTRHLSSQKMQHLMEQVQNSFDLVIYDAPPLLGFADVYLMATHTNGILLVTELGKLKRSVLEQALEQLRVSNTPVLGIVLQKLLII